MKIFFPSIFSRVLETWRNRLYILAIEPASCSISERISRRVSDSHICEVSPFIIYGNKDNIKLYRWCRKKQINWRTVDDGQIQESRKQEKRSNGSTICCDLFFAGGLFIAHGPALTFGTSRIRSPASVRVHVMRYTRR